VREFTHNKPLKTNKMTLRKVISQSEFQKSVVLAQKNPANRNTNKVNLSSYIMVDGVPCKMVNGQIVSLTKIVK
jgi:hypothetical protein